MKLSRVQIKNYLSIKDLEINFDPKCQILVGINESGKTNILKALNLLDPKAKITTRDRREAGLLEEQVTEAYVRFVFSLGTEEAVELLSRMKPLILSKTYTSPVFTLGDKNYTLYEFCSSREGIYRADIMSGTKYASSWNLSKGKVPKELKKVREDCPAEYAVPDTDSESKLLADYALVDTSEYPDIPKDYIEDATPDDLEAASSDFIKEQVEKQLLKVLFWDYEESKLLPPRINLDTFCATPESCIPLKRMFQLYGISDIKKAVTEAKAGSANALDNLLRRVAQRTSDHFHNTWKEYGRVRFSLKTNGPDLEAGIQDESNIYELAQRSDGFKRFVTFLLLVSAEEATNELKDSLLLIDEPEIGLHPSGARYLRDELIDISKNNYVVFSTHSIFMVDNKTIRRHLIVRKTNEITHVEQVTESNIQEEKVIYQSLGYSIFSNLKEKNLIFEGWRDKKLFDTAIARVPAEYEEVKALKNIGRCFAHGVKQIKNITPLFEAGDRKCLILSDRDPVAREHQKEYRDGKFYGVWKRYDEVVEGAPEITGEDFIKEGAFEKLLARIQEKLNLPPLPVDELNAHRGRVHAIRNWLRQNGVPQEDIDPLVEEVKDGLFAGLKTSEIRIEYYDHLRAILPIVDAL